MRLFTGFALDYPVRRNLELLLEHLRPLAPLAWSPPSNLHVTTRFLGEFPDEKLNELREDLARLPKPGPIELHLEGLGWFDNPHNPRSLFVGVKRHENLMNFSGIDSSERAYIPHVTLARVRSKTDLSALRRAIAELPSASFGVSIPKKHLLYRSEPGPDSSSYTVIGEFEI